MWIAVIKASLARERAMLLQQLDNDGVRFPNCFADQFVRQRAGRALSSKHAASRIHRAVHADTVALTDNEVVLPVTRRSVDCSRALFQRDVITQKADRVALKKRMTKDCPLQLCAWKPRDHLPIPAKRFRHLREQTFGHDYDALRSIYGNILELRVEADGKVGRNGPGRCSPD